MRVRFGLRWQITLVVVLFAASLIALLSSNLAALWLPARQNDIQNQLAAASRRMAEAAAPLLEDEETLRRKKPPGEWHSRLADITEETLSGLTGVEGGFYLGDPWDQFTGYAFPNDLHAPPEPPPPPGKLHPPKGKHHPLPKDKRPLGGPLRDPPPKEKRFVLAQCRASLTAESGASPIVQVLDVPPSRVMVVTEPVGRERPARLSTWVMVRLTAPEQMAADMRRYQTATGLALAGILIALVLTLNLGRNLRLERQQRDQLREELRRSEHLAVLGKLLAGVAHEVRNPLAAIHSTAQLYQRLPPQARDPAAMDAVLHGVERINALVSRLLFFARSGYEEKRPVDLNAVVRETLVLARAQADTQGVVLQTELAADLPPVSGSAQALQQVVLNLTTNALQAMPNGGTLHWQTRRLDTPPRVQMSIADTGPGIAAADRTHLFEPFWTTRPEGTGLGLALCREIVQQHGGLIEVDAQPGWGTVFRVTLPHQ
ncbi:MAG TPA: ATP-binding protein [Gemmataceae bacterium]|nr:ATP-binding protein [Gemmataceae bacterium]